MEHSEDYTWRLVVTLITIYPCGWSTVGLLHIPVSVEAESPVAVAQPLRYLVVGCFLQLLRDFSKASKGAKNPSSPVPGRRRPIGSTAVGKGIVLLILHLHG
jgi:hypothetical protein